MTVELLWADTALWVVLDVAKGGVLMSGAVVVVPLSGIPLPDGFTVVWEVELVDVCVWLVAAPCWALATCFFFLPPTPPPTAAAMITTRATTAIIIIPFLVR